MTERRDVLQLISDLEIYLIIFADQLGEVSVTK